MDESVISKVLLDSPYPNKILETRVRFTQVNAVFCYKVGVAKLFVKSHVWVFIFIDFNLPTSGKLCSWMVKL